MSQYIIVVVNPGYETYAYERKILEPIGAQFIVAPVDCATEDQVISEAKNADAILVREGPITSRVIMSLNRLKIIARYGTGVDNVDLKTARERKIYVSIVPDYGTEDVSDHAVALLLACIRTLTIRDNNVRKGKFETDITAEIYRTTGKNLGIIGYGKIARAFHRKWKGFLPSKVLVYDPYVVAEEIEKNGAEKVQLDTLFAESDYITLHTPLTPETRHLINDSALKKIKKTAILVNTSRGGIIDEQALTKALRENRILAAGLDVFETEPLAADNPLVEMPNVILTPHMSWYSKDSTKDLQTQAAQEVLRVLSGKHPEIWVNPW